MMLARNHLAQQFDVAAVLQRVRESGLLNDARVKGHVNLALLRGDSAPVLQIIGMLRPNNPDRPPHPYVDLPDPDAVAGEILAGYLVNPDWTLGHAVYLKIAHFDRHVVNVGAPGKGKTFWNRSAMLQLHHAGVRFLALDSENEFWDLPAYAAPGEIVRCAIKAGDFQRNPFEPLPGETFAEIDARMRDINREVWIGDGGVNLGTEIAFEMHQRQGLFTVREFYEELLRRRSKLIKAVDMRRAQYLEGLINRFSGLVLHLGGTYDALNGFPFDALASRSWIFNLQGLASDTRVFFPVELLAAFDDYKAALRDGELRNVLFLEEGHRFIKSAGHAETILGEPLLFDTVRTGRKRMLGVVTTTQEAKDLPSVISGNSATHLYFQTQDGASIARIASDHSLSSSQAALFPELPDRFAVMRHPEVAKPFLVRMPEISFNFNVTEEQIAELMVPIFSSLKRTPSSDTNAGAPAETDGAPVIDRNDPSNDGRDEGRHEARHGGNAAGVSRDVESAMSSDLLDDLEEIGANAFEAATARDQRRGISLSVGNARREKLKALGLIEERPVRLARRGNPTKLLEVTDKGWAVLESYKRKANRPVGRGSFVHQFWQHKVAEHVKASLPDASVAIEDQTNGKAVDVLVRIDGSVFGIEISETTRPEDELRNVEADVRFCDLVFVLAEGERHLQSISELVAQEVGENLNRVRFSTLVEFCGSPPSFKAKLL